ncbi:hypothetical protein [Calothrix sp. NIES-2098]|uniref:hypothetical protein n=1 Tax=Calothrix sp. NIES-2098 TaxID=1954171 RepID=UPI000B5F4B73|nr:hypothetical protein NIES2098_34490 [Calothrix sp. NIES-2098]
MNEPKKVRLSSYRLKQLDAEDLEKLEDSIIVESEEVNPDELSDEDYEQWQIEQHYEELNRH